MRSRASIRVLGIDVGGSKVRYGTAPLTDGDGEDRHVDSRPSEALDLVLRVMDTEQRAAKDAGIDIASVAMCFPEYVRDGLLTSHDVIVWNEQPADAARRRMPDVPIVVESDVRCGALAEATADPEAARGSLLYVALGTGLSACLVVDGRPVPGARGEAIALGEFRRGRDDGANLESLVSGRGIAAAYAARTGRSRSAVEITVAAERGDSIAAEVLCDAGRHLGETLGDVVALLDPTQVVLGGGLGAAQTMVWAGAKSVYEAQVSRRPDPPPIRQATFGARSAIVGTWLLAREALQ